MAPRRSLIIALAAVYLIWGSTYFAIRVAVVGGLPPLLMAGSRFIIAGSLLFLWLAIRGGLPRTTPAHWSAAAWCGLLLFGGGNGVVCMASPHLPSGLATLLIAITPLWLVLLTWAVDRRMPDVQTWLAMAAGLIGVAVLMRPDPTHEASPWAMVAVLGAALSWAGGMLLAKRLSRPGLVLHGAALQQLWGGIFLLVAGCLHGELGALHVPTHAALGAYVYLIFVGSLIGFAAFAWLVQHAPPALASSYAYVNPLVALLIGTWLGGEPMTPAIGGGAALIVLAVLLMARRG